MPREYGYHPNYEEGSQEPGKRDQKKKRAGVFAKAALLLSGAVGTGIVGGSAFEAGRAYQNLARTRAEQSKEYVPSEKQLDPESPALEEELESQEHPQENEDNVEITETLPVTIISKEIIEENGQNYVRVAAMAGDLTYGLEVPVAIKPGAIKGEIEEKKFTRTPKGEKLEVTMLVVTGVDGTKSKI